MSSEIIMIEKIKDCQYKNLAFMLIDLMSLSDLRLVESYATVIRESLEKEKDEKEKS